MTALFFNAQVAVTTTTCWNQTIHACLANGSLQGAQAADSTVALARNATLHMWVRLLVVELSVLGVISTLEGAMSAHQSHPAINAMETIP